MVGEYDYRLVALSVVVAIVASYTALDLAGRVGTWIGGGAIAMGTGVWSMHFVAMLAFELPIAMGYDIPITAMSWLMAVIAAAIALRLVSRAALGLPRLLVGAASMAAGIGGMHYTGMYAMRMQPGIVYDPMLVSGSLAVAFAASAAALSIAFRLRNAGSSHDVMSKAGAAVVMGMAIVGMHYTGMAAAHFPVGSVCGAASDLDPVWLATLVGVSTLLLLVTTLVASVLDRRLHFRTESLAQSLSMANAKLLHLSRHDPLTNLPNRALLQERLEQSLQRWRNTRSQFAVIYVDLDGFKVINDHLGHNVGDDLLRRVARAMVSAVRRDDTVARLGGDEFVLVVNSIDGDDAVARICSKLRTEIGRVRKGGIQLSASVGSALCPRDAADAGQLIMAADLAMYAVKRAGRNGQQSYRPEMHGRVSEEFEIQKELRVAIRSGGLGVAFQPKYRTSDRSLAGAEALVRWSHPQRGSIPPDRFIHVAERCGLIVEVEQQVLDRVCGQIRRWLDLGLAVPPISVNVSAVRMREQDLMAQVQACLDRHGIDPGHLVFEITESTAMDDIGQTIRTLRAFERLGIQIALDDFGTGHSSLSYLRQLPIQELKIDRTFVTDLAGEDGSQAQILRSIISLAHALQLRVVAEGVETEQQLACLAQFECDQVQGYLLSHPLPADEIARLMAGAGERPRECSDGTSPVTGESA
jgi:diguanylate cyclase (GGDEF)-like protein